MTNSTDACATALIPLCEGIDPKILIFLLLGGILGLLLSGRFRHDLVAAGGLLTAVVIGLVPQDEAFSGFSNQAVLIVVLVLLASRAFENSGVLGIAARYLSNDNRSLTGHIGLVGGIGAGLSGVINNVAALALLMPIDIQAARKAGRAPGLTLMPLAYATILGGMVTLIGTPPNIVASAVREENLGAPYQMFDFTPVGLAVALAGITFVAVLGWRLVPKREDKAAALVRDSSFDAHLEIGKDSPLVGKTLADLDEKMKSAGVDPVWIIRNGKHRSRHVVNPLQEGDVLVVRGSTDGLAEFIKSAGLLQGEAEEGEAAPEALPFARAALERRLPKADKTDKTDKADKDSEGAEKEKEEDKPKPPQIIEAVVQAQSWLVGRSASTVRLRERYGMTLLGIARAGRFAREEVQKRRIEAGDMLLLTGPNTSSTPTLESLGLISIEAVSVASTTFWKAGLAIGLFVLAIALASTGQLSFTVAIAIAVAGYGAFGLIPARDFYQNVDWSVVVMLACLLPVGAAFQDTGGTALVVDGIAAATATMGPIVALVAIMVVTMTLSDMLNNVATMVIAGPIAIGLAQTLGVNPDTFLMGVAVAASCAFLTPIGHKNNMLIMGPGGFRFGDYWRMGLPLEAVVLLVGVPMLLWIWPLYP